jgi:hypothetical protein
MKCEPVHLNAAGVFDAGIDAEAAVAEHRELVEQSHAMPDHVKAMALATDFKPEWAEAAHSSAVTKLREALAPCNATKPSAALSLPPKNESLAER